MQKNGFTLIEVLIVIGLIGLIAAIGVPKIRGRLPQQERKETFAKLNALTAFAWQNALKENKIHKVVFDFQSNKVYFEVSTDEYKKDDTPIFKPVDIDYAQTSFLWPENLEIKQFFLENVDEIRRNKGPGLTKIYFYIMPDGLAQHVTINGVDVEDEIDDEPRQFGLVLNPFTAQFKDYGSFQSP